MSNLFSSQSRDKIFYSIRVIKAQSAQSVVDTMSTGDDPYFDEANQLCDRVLTKWQLLLALLLGIVIYDYK